MVMLAEQYRYVIGGNPDRDTVDLAVVDCAAGGTLAHLSGGTDGPAIAGWCPGRNGTARQSASGPWKAPAGLAMVLAEAGEQVVEVGGLKRPRGASLRRRYRNKAELVAAVIGSLRVEDPPAGAPSPRAHALAILENFHRNLRAIPALAILGSLLAEEERHPELLHLFKTRIVEPRRALLRQALANGDLPNSTDSTPPR
jgi:hypothetical protein